MCLSFCCRVCCGRHIFFVSCYNSAMTCSLDCSAHFLACWRLGWVGLIGLGLGWVGWLDEIDFRLVWLYSIFYFSFGLVWLGVFWPRTTDVSVLRIIFTRTNCFDERAHKSRFLFASWPSTAVFLLPLSCVFRRGRVNFSTEGVKKTGKARQQERVLCSCAICTCRPVRFLLVFALAT